MRGASYVLFGGTGTLGRETVRQLLSRPGTGLIRIVSRDELKQKQMAAEFSSQRLEFRLGDIRDFESIRDTVSTGSDIFHFAALKHIDVCEENPEEAIRTNILGSMNVVRAARAAHARMCVFSSTDKAVDPINLYGMCKGISERLMLAQNGSGMTQFSVFRWGNVAASRGSFLPEIVARLKAGESIPVTHPHMSRFWIRIEDAVSFMLRRYQDASTTEAEIPPMRAATLMSVINTAASLLDVATLRVHQVGMRKGEKLHEAITSSHSLLPVDSQSCEQYSREELIEFLKPIVEASCRS